MEDKLNINFGVNPKENNMKKIKEKVKMFKIKLYIETDKRTVLKSFNSIVGLMTYCLYSKIKDLAVWNKEGETFSQKK